MNADNKADVANTILSTLATSLFGGSGGTTPPSGPGRRASTSEIRTSTTDSRHHSSVSDYAGRYSSAGYGPLVLCAGADTSASCRQVLADFESIDGHVADSSSLFAIFPSILSTHVRLTPLQGNQFTLTFTNLFPAGYGKNTTPFEAPEGDIVAEFAKQGNRVVGLGFLSIDGEVSDRQKDGGSVEEIADVWFAKI